MKPERIDLARKYEPRVLRLVPDGCWTIPGLKLTEYGYLNIGYHSVRAHRVFYEAARGPVPEGLVLDHTCRNRACINPDHLEPVPSKVNTLRGEGVTARKARQTHCRRGHQLSGANLLIKRRQSGTYRNCRECAQAYNARRRIEAALARAKDGGA